MMPRDPHGAVEWLRIELVRLTRRFAEENDFLLERIARLEAEVGAMKAEREKRERQAGEMLRRWEEEKARIEGADRTALLATKTEEGLSRLDRAADTIRRLGEEECGYETPSTCFKCGAVFGARTLLSIFCSDCSDKCLHEGCSAEAEPGECTCALHGGEDYQP